MFYVSPEHTFETVKVIAVTPDGCIVETLDGHPINIGQYNAQPGQYIDVMIDQRALNDDESLSKSEFSHHLFFV